MRSVQRSEPGFLDAFRANHRQWDDLGGSERRRIREALSQEFGPNCVYCQKSCSSPSNTADSADEETIDHFRPRRLFPDLWLDWLNLVYACRRCNQVKADNWPGYDGELVDRVLAAEDPRYSGVSEYVSPNATQGRRPAQEFFSYDVQTGEISPSELLDPVEWSIARRTIRDIDLNDMQLGENGQNHLWNRRKTQRDFLNQTLDRIGEGRLRERVISTFTSHEYPFSSFVTAYVSEAFPEHFRPLP